MTDQHHTEFTFTTSTGKVLGEAEIEAIADEFASTETFDIEAIRQRGRPRLGNGASEVIQFRVDRELAAQLRARTETEHTTQSQVLREALARYLAS